MKKLCTLLFFGSIFLLTITGCKEKSTRISSDREEVILRKIGHEILLSSGNSTSRVQPIIKEENQYRIQFDADFGFPPEGIAMIIDTILKNSPIQENYLVKIEKCTTGDVVYSYEVDVFSPRPFTEELACGSRPQPKDCYEVVIHFLSSPKNTKSNAWLFIVLPLILLLIAVFILRKKRTQSHLNKHKIKLGDYLYDPKRMVLIRQERTIELTSKENELLSLLNQFANETVNKETILNKVWGDEGDYVGRTLDVYISKLRKKLENDASIELKNVRGVGYKLIVGN